MKSSAQVCWRACWWVLMGTLFVLIKQESECPRACTHVHSAHSWMSWMNGDFSQGNKMLRLELEALSCVFLFDWFLFFCPRYLEGPRASSLLGWFLTAMDCYHQKQQTWMASFIPELLSQVCFLVCTYLSLRNLSGRSYCQLTRNICSGEWNFLLKMTSHRILKESHGDKSCCQSGGWGRFWLGTPHHVLLTAMIQPECLALFSSNHMSQDTLWQICFDSQYEFLFPLPRVLLSSHLVPYSILS